MTQWQPLTDLPDLRHVGLIALDTETKDERLAIDKGSGWPFKAGHICGVNVAWREGESVRAAYFPIRHPDSANFDPAQVFQWLRDLIASDVRFVTQNGLYDWGWLRADTDIKMPAPERLEEIGALATLIDENRYAYGLDALCAWRGLPGKDLTGLLEGAAAIGLPKKAKPQAHIWQMPARYVGPYAEQDAISTLLLFESLDPVLDREGMRTAYRLEIDLLPMVHEMRRRGIRVDTTAAERARDLLSRKRDAVLAELSQKHGAAVGMDEIAGKKWLEATFDQYGIKYPRTKKGNPSFTSGQRGWMHKHSHWLPQLIAKANKYNKAAVDFLEGHILRHVVNGRIHAEIHPHRSDDDTDASHGTRSLRFSYSEPPLQQMAARDEEIAPLIRGVFLPEEGEVWAKPDISQQEFRLIVHYGVKLGLKSAEEAADRYRNDPNADIHKVVAEMTGLDRGSAKNCNFAKVYGVGLRTFAVMIGKSEREAEAIMTLYDQKFPFVQKLSDRCERQAKQQGYLVLYDDARRHWDNWVACAAWGKGAGPCDRDEAERRLKDPEHSWYRKSPLRRADTRKAFNALIQGSAARHTKLWMRLCWREGIVPLVQMHDCLDLSVSSPEQAELVARLGREAITLEVPIQVDLKYGRNWGDATHTWAELHNGGAAAPMTSIAELPETETVEIIGGPILNDAGNEVEFDENSGDDDENLEPDISADRDELDALLDELPEFHAAEAVTADAAGNDARLCAAPPTAVIANAGTVDPPWNDPPRGNPPGNGDGNGSDRVSRLLERMANFDAGVSIGNGADRAGNGHHGDRHASGKIRCPYHDDHTTPNLHIYPGEDDPHFHCFVCGAHGHLDDLDVDWSTVTLPVETQADNTAGLARALDLWGEAKPIASTIAEKYLGEVRGLDVRALPSEINESLRFHARCPFGPGNCVPGLIALYRDVETDEPAGIHRIALVPEVFTGAKVERRTLGRWPRPRAIKLWCRSRNEGEFRRLFLGEGIETVLAAATRLQHHVLFSRDGTMTPAWAGGHKIGIEKFPLVYYVDELVLLVDHDTAGEQAAAACYQRWRAAGRRARRLRTQHVGLNDFNDLVLAKLRGACHDRL
jgi:DNA polymerase I-like protein with 3'-5' exonuclease and polymerase domains